MRIAQLDLSGRRPQPTKGLPTRQHAAWTERWSLIGIIVVGAALMLFARLFARSPFFQISRESEPAAASLDSPSLSR